MSEHELNQMQDWEDKCYSEDEITIINPTRIVTFGEGGLDLTLKAGHVGCTCFKCMGFDKLTAEDELCNAPPEAIGPRCNDGACHGCEYEQEDGDG